MTESKLLTTLTEHVCRNAKEVLADDWYWSQYSIDAKIEFEEAVGRCMNGNGTDTDWAWLMDMTDLARWQ